MVKSISQNKNLKENKICESENCVRFLITEIDTYGAEKDGKQETKEKIIFLKM